MSRRTIFILMGLFLSVLVATGFFAYQAYFTPEVLKRREVAKWVEIIGKNVELPKNETPAIATVTNKGKLGDQEFFVEAENGDKVLIYTRSSRAYLYRPSTGKLIGMTTDIDIEKTR